MRATKVTEAEPIRCLKCHRRLRNPSFDGLGPKCRRKVFRASRAPQLAAQYKSDLVDKAIDLLEMGGLIPLRDTGKNAVFLAVSSDGTTAYRTARAACTCPAGLKAKHMCCHRIAAHVVELAA
ncbi:hypothetical protein [Streptomyces carpinensis]|uniref:SWIM-type domain-containing protein n=1 Tax=Streptomyces carpinensis TaxID=66369 RepID=A0ABV1W9Q4_9ACTN|nr:hypothetical protein [Streptomyces carpinensis]